MARKKAEFIPYATAKESLLQYATATRDIMARMTVPEDFKGYRGMADVVLQHGRAFQPGPAKIPYGLRRGEMKQCFTNSQKVLLRHSWAGLEGLTYVEGYVLSIIPIHHGWLVNRDGLVIDLTLREPGAAYVGVPIRTRYVLNMVNRTQHFGAVFDNWQDDPPQPIISGAHPQADWLETMYELGEPLCS